MSESSPIPFSLSVLGLDIGRVITKDSTDGNDDVFGDNYLNSLPRPGSLLTIRELVNQRYGDDVHLISKCKSKIELRTRELLEQWNFYDYTGVLREHVHFCPTIEEKAVIAAQLGVTTMVDDRLAVLHLMPPAMQKVLFVPHGETVPRRESGIEVALGWAGIHELLLPELTQ